MFEEMRLIDGKNACPPNDVGGIDGYKEMLRIIKENPDGDEAWEYYTWRDVGGMRNSFLPLMQQ